MEMAVSSHERVALVRPAMARKHIADAGVARAAQRGLQWVLLIALSVICYLLISHYVIVPVRVQGQSMLPTLHDADSFFLNRWTYCLHSPQRGDVVVLKDPSDGTYAVKRIIATEGDAIYLKRGKVYVNGLPLDEPYLNPGTPTYPPAPVNEQMVVCGRDRYYVMGDNRNNSFDSRYYGPVPRQNILGAIRL
jgi:signal peptidase I